MLSHVSEISFPIQKRIEFGRLGELDLVDPAGALGVFIDELGLADPRLVYTKDFAAYGRIEVACGLDRLDNADRAALLHLLADVRELNKGSEEHPRSEQRGTYRLEDALALLGHRCQSSSASRFTAGESGFVLSIQCRERPD